MKIKTFAILIPILLLTAHLRGQITGDDIETPNLSRVQAQRVAYITQRLGLTTDESASFWAMVNEYENKQREIRQKYRPAKGIQLMTDQEAEQYIRSTFDRDRELLELKESYYGRFKEILPPSKIALFPIAENEFKRVILRQVRENIQRRRQGNRD
jgi:hypothetical protein